MTDTQEGSNFPGNLSSSFNGFTTELTSQNESSLGLFTPVNTGLKVTSSIILIVLMLTGIALNTATIIVLIRTKTLKNIYNDFILSMSFSNLFAALISWINLYRLTWGYNEFTLSVVFCKMYWAVEMWTSYATAWHIMSFAILRMMSVKWSTKVKRITRKQGKIWQAIIWVVTFAFGFIPMTIFINLERKDRTKKYGVDAVWPHCSTTKYWMSTYSAYSAYAYPIFILIPIVVVIVVSIYTAMTIRRNRKRLPQESLSEASIVRRRKQETQALTQLIFIVSSFLIGYIPFIAFEYYTQHTVNSKSHYGQRIWLFGTFAYYLLRISECLDPIFYCLGSRKIRVEMLNFAKSIASCWRLRLEDRNMKRNTNTVTSERAPPQAEG